MSRKLVLVVITSILLVSLHGSTAFARIISNDEFLDSYDVEVSSSTAYVSVPFYYQNNNYYCGPAALEMIFDYYGEDIPQTEIADVARTYPYVTYTDELRRAAHFSNLSTSLGDEMPGNITAYSAREVGYAAFEQWGLTTDDLKTLISKGEPLIVLMWWTPSKEYGHYRVVVGYNETHIIMHDPWNKDLWGGTYGGANTTMTYSTFLDLWEYSGNWTLWMHPWDIELQIPSTVSKGDNFEVTANITYPCSTPFDAFQYSAFSSNATIELQQGLELGSGETTQHSLGNITAGNSVQTSWSIHATETGSYNISVTATGIIEGSVWTHGTYPSYDYEDAIGGLCVNSLSIITQTGRVHNLDTGLNYTSIQEAIDANETLDGHTIFVEEGIYYENLIVSKSLSLIGENTGNTIIDGMRKSHVVHVNADNVKIMNFTIRNSSRQLYPNRSAIYIGTSNHCNITQNQLTDNLDGISINHSFNTTIYRNNLTANSWTGIGINESGNNSIFENNVVATKGDGIRLEASSNNTIYKNNIANNTVGGIRQNNSPNNLIYKNNITTNSFRNSFGIWLTGSSNGNISGNTLVNCGMIVVDSYSNVVENNIVNGKPLVYLEGISNHKVQEAGQVIAVNCDDIRANNLNLSHATVGVELWETDNSEIGNNSIFANSFCGVILEQSYNNGIWGNNITGNSHAMRLGWFGGSSNNNTISGNKVANNEYGIYLGFSSNNNTVSKNEVKKNYWDGIYVYSSNFNIIMGNNINGNRPGIYFIDSSDNVVFHNNFINNNGQVYTNSINVWDYGCPCEGNYWSDYNGTDPDNDGVGNTPYTIDINNTDKSPLMGIFSSFNTSVGKYVNVGSNSTIEDFEYFESNNTIIMHASNMTANQTFGFCRICVPHALMIEPYNVTIDGAVPIYWNYTLYDDGDNRWIYFSYQHSILEIVIIPEFPSLLILPLFMIATLLTVIIYKRKTKKKP